MAFTKRELQQILFEEMERLKTRFPHYYTALKEYGYRCSVSTVSTSRILGFCNVRERRIVLNEELVSNANDAQVRDIIRHEFAHALEHATYNKTTGHSKRWKAIAERVGATPYAKAKTRIMRKTKLVQFLWCKKTKTLIYLNGYSKRPPKFELNVFRKDAGLTVSPTYTLNKLIVTTWDTWEKICADYHLDPMTVQTENPEESIKELERKNEALLN